MRVPTRQIALGMIQQMEHAFPECRDSGESISERDRCQQCNGKKVTQEKKVLEVHVEKGMQNGQKIVFEGQADEAPDTVTGTIPGFGKLSAGGSHFLLKKICGKTQLAFTDNHRHLLTYISHISILYSQYFPYLKKYKTNKTIPPYETHLLTP